MRLRADRARLASSHSPPQPADRVGVLAGIEALLLSELLGDQVHQPLVPVAAAQHHVAVGGQRDEFAAAGLDHRDVERAAAQVVDQDLLAGLVPLQQALPEPERQGRRRGLVNDVQDFQPGDVAGILRPLAADFIEVGRDGDHDFLEIADLPLGVVPQLVQDAGLDGLGRVLPVVEHLVIHPLAHLPLDAVGHVASLARQGLEGFLAHHDLRALEKHGTGRDLIPFRIHQRLGATQVVQVRDRRVGRTQVDTDGRMCTCSHEKNA